MKSKICILASLALGVTCLSTLAQETLPGGIVHGPKASFNLSAPEGWVVDAQSGVKQGMPCVLYPKGRIVVGREDGDVREGSQPSMGRRKRIRGNGDQRNEGETRHAKGENRVRQN